MKVIPDIHPDGKETVTLWGKTFDVTGKRKFKAFKREFQIYRPRKKKVEDTEVTNDEQ